MKNNKEIINELWESCMEYPPKQEKIRKILDEIKEISVLYSAFGEIDDPNDIFRTNDFLSNFLEEYMVTINKDWFGYNQYDSTTSEWKYIPPIEPTHKIRHETYVVNIVKMFLEYGYDMCAADGKVGASCLDALVYSFFNDELVNVAKLLITAGANPKFPIEDGMSILDNIYSHCVSNEWYYPGIEEDDYLDNRFAMDSFYELCAKTVEQQNESK